MKLRRDRSLLPPPDDVDAAVADAEAGLKPSTMRRPEPLYGYLIALELLAISVINLVVRHGKGAPKHPDTGVAIIGLVASLGLFLLIQSRHRFIVGFGAIVAAFLVTLPKGPNSIQLYHLFGLVFPVVFALVLTQRQNRATKAQVKAGLGPKRATPAERRAAADARHRERRDRRRGIAPAATTGPKASRRYTPPKARRPRR